MKKLDPYRVLLVDDDPDDRLLIEEDLRAIQRWRAEITSTATYEEALAAIHAGRFDIALVDYRLGERKGTELLLEPAMRAADLPVIILTGGGDAEVDLIAGAAGAADFLPKQELGPVLLERAIRYTVGERRRHRVEARFRALIENSRDLIMVLDEGGVIQYASPSLENVLGFEPSSVLDRNLLDEIHPQDVAAVRAALEEVALPDGTIRRVEYRIRHRGGNWRRFDTFVQNSLADPQIAGFVVNSRDVTELHEAESRLSRTAGLLQQVLASLEEAIFVVMPPDRRVVECSAAVEAIFGYTREELIGNTTEALYVSEESRNQLIELVSKALQRGEPFLGEWQMRRRDGTVFPTDHMVTLLDPALGPEAGVVHVVRDRTERHRQERQVRFQSDLLDHVGQPVIALDEQHRITYWNEATTRMTGWRADDVMGRPILELLVPPDERDKAMEGRATVMGGGAWSGEIRIRRRDGSVVPVLVSSSPAITPDGRPGGTIATGFDLTERRASEELRAAAVSRLHFQARLLDAVGQAVIATDLDGRVVYWNAAAESLYGWSAEEAIGQLLAEIAPADAAPEIRSEAMDALYSGRSWTGEFQVRRRDGSTFSASVTDAPIVNADGNLSGFIRVASDVTEQKQLADRLRQAQKMEAIGRLAGGVAHDFNNLLTAIKGHAALLLEELDTASDHADDVRQILSSADSAAALTRQLLAFSRKQVLESRDVELSTLSRELEPMLRRLIPERISFEVDAAGSETVVRADPTQLHQVVMNLVVNAVDAIEDTGAIRLAVKPMIISPDDAAAFPWHVVPGPYVCVSVQDSGHGMEPDVAKQIFEPFFTTKPEGRGTGLGLATVYGIVKQTGGHIRVHSEPGAGSRFDVLLPRSDAVPEETSPAPVALPPRKARGETVLLVEDDDFVRSLARRVLSRTGYDVLTARNGIEALEIAEKKADSIDLVVSDVIMPEMGGGQLVDRLRERYPDLKVILTSGYSEEELRGEIRHKAAGFLVKPFTPEKLTSLIARVLG